MTNTVRNYQVVFDFTRSQKKKPKPVLESFGLPKLTSSSVEAFLLVKIYKMQMLPGRLLLLKYPSSTTLLVFWEKSNKTTNSTGQVGDRT